eukprot:2430308-Amphidinium_carterae.1
MCSNNWHISSGVVPSSMGLKVHAAQMIWLPAMVMCSDEDSCLIAAPVRTLQWWTHVTLAQACE